MRPMSMALVAMFGAAPLGAQMGSPATAEPAAAAAAPTPASASRVKLKLDVDRFNGTRVVVPDGDPPNLPGLGVLSRAFVFPHYKSIKGGASAFVIDVLGVFTEWCFLDGSIELLIDGTPEQLPAQMRPETDVSHGGSVSEEFRIVASADLVRRIGAARNVEIRLPGTRHSIESRLRPEAIAQFQAILGAPAMVGDTLRMTPLDAVK